MKRLQWSVLGIALILMAGVFAYAVLGPGKLRAAIGWCSHEQVRMCGKSSPPRVPRGPGGGLYTVDTFSCAKTYNSECDLLAVGAYVIHEGACRPEDSDSLCNIVINPVVQ